MHTQGNSFLSTLRVVDSHCRLKSDTKVVREHLNVQFNSQQGQKAFSSRKKEEGGYY